MTTILGAIIGTASALTLCILMTAIIVKCKRCRKPVTNKDYDDGGLASNERHCVVVANDKASCEPLNKEKDTNGSVTDNSCDEKNPDIIPHNNLDDDFESDELAPFERLNNIFPRSYQRLTSPKALLKNSSYDFYNAQFV